MNFATISIPGGRRESSRRHAHLLPEKIPIISAVKLHVCLPRKLPHPVKVKGTHKLNRTQAPSAGAACFIHGVELPTNHDRSQLRAAAPTRLHCRSECTWLRPPPHPRISRARRRCPPRPTRHTPDVAASSPFHALRFGLAMFHWSSPTSRRALRVAFERPSPEDHGARRLHPHSAVRHNRHSVRRPWRTCAPSSDQAFAALTPKFTVRCANGAETTKREVL